MDKERDLSVLRARSSQAAIGDGYRLYTSNFRKIFKASWAASVIYALVVGLLGCYFMGHVLPLLCGAGGALMPAVAVMGAIGLLFIVVALLLASTAFQLLAEHRATGAMAQRSPWYGRLSLKALWRMLRLVLRWLKHCKRAFKFLGMIVGVGLMVALVTLLLTAIGQLPGHVLTIANIEAQTDAATGDALGLPDNIGLINFATFTVVGFIQAYIHLSTLFPFYYVHATIKLKK